MDEEVLAIAEKAAIRVKDGVGSKSWAARLRSKAKQLVKQSDEIFMELGKILYIIWDTPDDGTVLGKPLYQKWGYESFNDYVETELDLDYRKAQRLKRIWYTLDVTCRDIDPALKTKLIALGTTRLRDLSRVITPENAADWYEQVKDLTAVETANLVQATISGKAPHLRFAEAESEAEVAEARSNGVSAESSPVGPSSGVRAEVRTPTVSPPESDFENENEAPYNENFKLYPSQQRNLKDALEAARILSNSPKAKKGHCLDLICMDFLATNDIATKDPERTRETYLNKMEKRLGIRLVAIDTRSGDIVYGLESLEALARKQVDP